MATGQPVLNLPSRNSIYVTGGSRKMFFYKLPTNPGKNFEDRTVEISQNLEMRYNNGICLTRNVA
jgi:hypothetical protein